MDIVIISQYLREIEDFEGNNSRFVYLAQMLEGAQHSVEIITSDFMHAPKTHAKKIGELGMVKITALHEPGYPKNVCLKRFSSHKQLAKNMREYLSQRKKPDLVYAAVPSLDVAEVAADYCKKNSVRFIIDIQDLWPEAFKMVFSVPIVSNLAFKPMERKANKIYAAADAIVAVSQTYARRAMSVNRKSMEPTVVYLGTDKDAFDRYAHNIGANNNGITISYIGSLAASYDLKTVIDAVARITTPVKLLVMGDGAYKEKFENYAKEKGIDAEFTGRLIYLQMVERLMDSDIAVNPIHKGSAASIINKVNDYAMAGLPVVNTQESQEYRALLDKYQAGINCECENPEDVYTALKKLIEDEKLRKEMAQNSRRLGDEMFNRAKTYKKIVALFHS